MPNWTRQSDKGGGESLGKLQNDSIRVSYVQIEGDLIFF